MDPECKRLLQKRPPLGILQMGHIVCVQGLRRTCLALWLLGACPLPSIWLQLPLGVGACASSACLPLLLVGPTVEARCHLLMLQFPQSLTYLP